MRYSILSVALLAALGLSACERPAVVVAPSPTVVAVPGPAGATGATGATGEVRKGDTGATGATGADGEKGDRGKSGSTTVVVVPTKQ